MLRFDPNNVKTPGARVAITAAGIVSPLGRGLAHNRAALQAARDCVTAVDRFDVTQCRCQTAGQISDDLLAGNGRSKGKHFNRAGRMLISAFEELFDQDGEFQPDLVVVGTTSGGMSFGESYYRALQRQGRLRDAPAWIANYPPQKPVADAMDAFGIRAPARVIANACASGTNAIGHAFACVRSGRYQRVITGGYDAISELVFVGFDSLQAATAEKCRPFDRDRSGMVLGEGAAALALENFETACTRGATILGEIIGYGISTDNYHLTQPDPSGNGPREAMQRALDGAQIAPSAVDYINAHGTATVFNDAAEGKAIADVFGNSVAVSSTKSLMGHSLGAAGAIEAVFSLLALQHQFLPPNINFRAADNEFDLKIVANESAPAKLDIVLSNSFGFGGTNASIVMRRPNA